MNFIKTLEDAIAGNNVFLARGSIITYVDHDSQEEHMCALEVADEVNRIFQKKGIALFEQEDHWLKPRPQEEWDAQYWNDVKAAMWMNFSREKIELASRVAMYLRKRGDADFQTSSASSTPSDTTYSLQGDRPSSRPVPSHRGASEAGRRTPRVTVGKRSESHSGAVAVAAAVGAVVGAVAGAVIAGTAAAGAVVGGVLAGGVAYCKTNKRER